jgi:putative ABC transport system ATP-binding protein
LEEIGLGERMDHKPNELSGGQQQRVAIGRALVNEAPLLMADEPTGNLDSVASVEIMTLFQHLNKEKGITLIVVTHGADIAAWAGRIVTFRDGLIIEDRPSKAKASPAKTENVPVKTESVPVKTKVPA